jgi:hypothetical protein
VDLFINLKNKTMTDKMYYFEIPDPIETAQEDQMKDILVENIGKNDDRLIFFVDAEKSTSAFYTLWSSYIVEKIISDFNKIGVIFSYKDVTEEVLVGTRNNNVEFKKLFSKENNKAYLVAFLKQGLSKDTILDKIGKHGIQSLTDLDKQILSAD